MNLSFIPSVSLTVVVALVSCTVPLRAASYATSVVRYDAGTGAAPGYQNPSSALGEPSRTAPAGPTDSPVNPFNPPWTASQLVSIGKGGLIVLQTTAAIQNDASHAYGVDFILFGNNGFQVVDYSVPTQDWATDGALFTFDPAGSSVVSVSENGSDFYRLVPPAGLSAAVDGLFPTDAAGDFVPPVDPHLNSGSFAGKTLDGIRALYAGSAGGAGFDLAWAETIDGKPAGISSAHYIRIDVLDGKVEVDSLVVVPEPSASILCLGSLAALLGFRRLNRGHNRCQA